MPRDRESHKPERPVSCRFCRVRKLRCSRESPCSNCVSRDIVCELPIRNPVRSTISTAAIPAGTSSPTQLDLLERIRKLEELVKSQSAIQSTAASDTPQSLPTHTSQSTLSPEANYLDDDISFLKSIYTAQTPSENTPSTKIAFRICPIQQIIHAQPYINQSSHISSTRFEPLRCVWIPQYEEAKILLQKFLDDIDHVHHITHSPSLPALLNEVYACLDQKGQVEPGSILLLLGIFTSSTHAWVQRDSGRGLFPTWQEANAQAMLWVKSVEDVLDIYHRTSSIPIEGIQGLSITTFALLNMEGFSRRCKSLFNMAFMLARELGLHFLDQPSDSKLGNPAQIEIGRRVWWFLVSTDWSLPSRRFNCGSQNIYHFHPRHMLVKKPLNINDEDISHDMRFNEQPLSQPTTMSYQLLQLRLSEISHNMVDRSPLVMGLGGPSHDVVMSIDTELQMLLIDTPCFFSMPVEELISDYHMDSPRASKIAHQGYMFYSQLYAQRCTLHIPYFVRGLTESAYATSSQICLQSACLIIQTESKLGKSRISAARYKFLGFLVPVFMSSIVLLIDSCYRKTSIHARYHREELAEAIRILEEAKHESGTAAKFLDSLTHVLRKHKVTPARQLPTPGPATAIQQQYGELPLLTSTLTGLDGNGVSMGDEMYSNGEGLSTYFAELAQRFGQGNEVADLDWNSMFSGIDSSMTWI